MSSEQLKIPRWVGKDLHERIVNDVWPYGVIASCTVCGASVELDVKQTAECLAHGWPKCCGRSMLIEGVR